MAEDAGLLRLAFFVAIAFGGNEDIDNGKIIVVDYVGCPLKISIFGWLAGYGYGHTIHFGENYIAYHLSLLWCLLVLVSIC